MYVDVLYSIISCHPLACLWRWPSAGPCYLPSARSWAGDRLGAVISAGRGVLPCVPWFHEQLARPEPSWSLVDRANQVLSSSLRLRLISSRETPTMALCTLSPLTRRFLVPSSVLIFLLSLLQATVHWISWLLILDGSRWVPCAGRSTCSFDWGNSGDGRLLQRNACRGRGKYATRWRCTGQSW